MASQVAVRLLIQTGRPLGELTDADFDEFGAAITERETAHGRAAQALPRRAATPPARCSTTSARRSRAACTSASTLRRWSWRAPLRRGHRRRSPARLVAYLECAAGTRARSTVQGIAVRAGALRPVPRPPRPGADLAGRAGPAAPHRALPGRGRRRAQPAHRRRRCPPPNGAAAILTVGRFLDDITEWGWPEAPGPAAGLPPRRPPAAAARCPATCPRTPTGALAAALRGLAEPAARRRAAAAARHRAAHRRAARPRAGLRARGPRRRAPG